MRWRCSGFLSIFSSAGLLRKLDFGKDRGHIRADQHDEGGALHAAVALVAAYLLQALESEP